MQLNPLSLPTPKEERWKYTNLARAIGNDLSAQEETEKVIHIISGENKTQSEEIVWSGVDGQRHDQKLKVVIEEGARLTLIETHKGDGVYWKNFAAQIELRQGARLDHIRLNQDSVNSVQTNMVSVCLAEDAVYNGHNINLSAKLIRHDITVSLQGEGAKCSVNGLNVLSGSMHSDMTIDIQHQAPKCSSSQLVRSVLKDRSRGVFQGKIHVFDGADGTDGQQLSNALILSEGAEMDTKPELEIYADDVQCTHGATVGALDEQSLFYLRSRGVSEENAKALLIKAFCSEVIDLIENDEIQTDIDVIVESCLRGEND